jgi:hypothetical protein
LQDWSKKYLELSEQESISIYLSKFIWQNKFKLSCKRRLRNLLTIFFPWVNLFYLKFIELIQQYLVHYPQLSNEEIKALVLEYPSVWRK